MYKRPFPVSFAIDLYLYRLMVLNHPNTNSLFFSLVYAILWRFMRNFYLTLHTTTNSCKATNRSTHRQQQQQNVTIYRNY